MRMSCVSLGCANIIPSCKWERKPSLHVADHILRGIVLGLQDVAHSSVLTVGVLHVFLKMEILQIEAHLHLLHLLCCIHEVQRGAASRGGTGDATARS